MDIEHREIGGSQVLEVAGEVDLASAPDLRSRLKALLEHGRRDVVVDLSRVEYMDSSGIAVLIEGARWAKRGKRQMVLAALSEQVRMVMELARLDGFFKTETTVEKALETFGTK